jgi:type III secretion protein D
MKQLRILTGIHAGATAPLAPGVYRIAADDDADIRITDWTGASALVEVSDGDVVTVRLLPVDDAAAGAMPDGHAAAHQDPAAGEVRHDGDAALQGDARQAAGYQEDDGNAGAQGAPAGTAATGGAPGGASAAADDTALAGDHPAPDTAPVFMLDFLPMQFDQSVLCIGPDDVEWPSDLQLLSTLLKPGQPADEAVGNKPRARHRTFIALGLACVVLLLVTCVSVLSMAPRAKASLVPQDVAAMENLNREFANAHLNELHAVLDGHGGVLVHGLVTNEADNLAARRLIAGVTAPLVQPQYGIAEVIRRSIGESLPIDGISVRYDGDGVFSIAGSNVDMDALQQGVRRIRHDLPSSVRDIRIDATGVEQPDSPASSGYVAMVSSDTVRYAQTPDGVKHIFILDDGSGDAAVSGAVAASAPAAAQTPGVAMELNAAQTAGGAQALSDPAQASGATATAAQQMTTAATAAGAAVDGAPLAPRAGATSATSATSAPSATTSAPAASTGSAAASAARVAAATPASSASPSGAASHAAVSASAGPSPAPLASTSLRSASAPRATVRAALTAAPGQPQPPVAQTDATPRR